MGLTIAGIIINQPIENVEDLEKKLNCTLKPFDAEKDQDSNGQGCEIYYSENSIFVKTDQEIVSEPIGILEGDCLTFMLSDTTNAYTYSVCKNDAVMQAFKAMGGERIEEFGKFTEDEKKADEYSYILQAIKNFCGTDLFELMESPSIQKFKISLNPIKLNFPKADNSSSNQKTKIANRKKHIPTDIIDPINLQRSDELYTLLLSNDCETVLNAISTIQNSGINTHTFSYISILSRFHWDTKVRREAKKIISLYASNDFWGKYNEEWVNNHRNTQGFYENKAYYEHEQLKTEEYFLFAFVNRRNFFDHRPMKGMYNTYNNLTDDKDEIQNVFQCHGAKIRNIPAKIIKEKDIRVARIMSAPNLHLKEALGLLSHLPNLHNLRLWWCELKELPTNINELKNLRRLGLTWNQLESFDSDIYLPKLEYLNIKHNQISELDLNCFPNLDFLSVDSSYSVKFKNVKKKLTVGSGETVFEVVEPN